jgi:predicted Zn-dependent peptidase
MSVDVTRLPTGLTIVTDSMPHLQTVTLGIWVGSGSRDEEPNEHGISHLLEHMAFKGTKRRTARQIAEEIEQVGGDLNAATSSETTAYHAGVLKTDMPLAVVLSDILTHPTFDPAELKREQNVIVQEIGASEDNPDDLVFDYLQSTAFPNQPIGRAILGTRETVCSFRDTNLRAYLARNYRGPDMVFAATGAVEHSAVVAEVECRFGQFNGPAAPQPLPASFGGGTRLEARDLEQVHIALALEGLSQKHADYFSLQVFAIVLGGGMSSRLFQEVREKRGLCYTISAFHAPYSDTGMFGIYAGTDSGDVKELMRVAVDETAAAAGNITEAEVNRAKAQIKVGLLMALESSGARARQLASQILTYGRPLPIEEIVARIDNVSVASTRATASALLARARPAIAALGPGEGLEGAATIAESLNRRAA